MLNDLKKHLRRDMAKPVIDRAFTRLMWGLAAALLTAFLISQGGGRDVRDVTLLLVSLLCLSGAWVCHLQLGGTQLPRLEKLRAKIDRKPKIRSYGDMIDHIDERPNPFFDEYDEEERAAVVMAADLICFVIFALLAVIVPLLF